MSSKPAAKKAAPKRPEIDRAAIVAKVCARMETGVSLRKSCEAEGVSEVTVLRWKDASPELSEQYTRAREAGLHAMAQQIIEISDEQEVEARYQGEDVKLDLSATAVARNRLRVDSRKWLLSKMLPKVYGDKLAIGGADDLPPIKTMDDEALSARIAALQAKVNKAGDGNSR